MRICFFGHSEFYGSDEVKRELISILKEYTGKEDCDFLFGGYGKFDDFAYRCVREICSTNHIKTLFITPYITESYLKNQLEYHKSKYDEVIYPGIENVPLKFAITFRNRWMVESSDLVITYVNHSFGGAYAMLVYARKKKKTVINLGAL